MIQDFARLSPCALHLDERIGGCPRYFLAPPGEALMFVPDEIRQCVCFLGCKTNPDREPILGGSAFFAAVALDDAGNMMPYLVTARHSIEKIAEKTCDSQVYLRMNIVGRGAEFIATQLQHWHFHPTKENIDVAVLPINYSPAFDHKVFPVAAFLTTALRTDLRVGLGDEVFFVGLFREHSGLQRNVPIVRVGNIAAMPEEPVRSRTWAEMDAYLVEGAHLVD